MTHQQDPNVIVIENEQEDMVRLVVTLPREQVALMKRYADREGAPVEALASLWLEERLDAAKRGDAFREEAQREEDIEEPLLQDTDPNADRVFVSMSSTEDQPIGPGLSTKP